MTQVRRWLTLLLLLVVFLGPAHFLYSVRSANLTNVSVTLSTPRLSFHGILDTGNTAGSSLVILDGSPGAAPSTSSANLFENDTVLIGSSQYRVASPSAGTNFSITGLPSTPGVNTLQTGDTAAGTDVIASRSAEFTVRFTTATAIADGAFRILVPSADTDFNDGLPDPDGWDYGTTVNADVTVDCPSNITGYTFAAGTGTAGSIVRDGRRYHSFVCSYTGAGGVGTAFDGTTNDAIVVDSLINPSPASQHVVGFSDTYPIIVEHLDSSNDIIDFTVASVAVIESVRVTAVVSPQITFQILGVASGESRCAITTSSSTTPTLVPLGELLIDTFKLASQQLVVSTNASNGYVVTAVAGGQLRRFDATCPGGDCIPHSEGDNSNMSPTVPDSWVDTAVKGFAYSLQDNDTNSVEFTHDDSAPVNCDGTAGSCYRQFSESTPVSLFGSSTVADSENLYVCYKAVISPTQAAGNDYATDVTYRATATF